MGGHFDYSIQAEENPATSLWHRLLSSIPQGNRKTLIFTEWTHLWLDDTEAGTALPLGFSNPFST